MVQPKTTLLTGGHIYTPGDPDATAMAITGETVVWIGQDGPARALYPDAEHRDLDGAFVAPAFVDAHVHATATGLLTEGVDLRAAGSAQDCLTLLRAAAAGVSEGGVLWAHGWDESGWPGQRIPSRTELDEAVGQTAVYASRIDAHSALVSGALLAAAPDVRESDGWSAGGPVTKAAHHAARAHAIGALSGQQRERAQRAFLAEAAAQGIAAVHECSGPEIAGRSDLAALLELGTRPELPDVTGYWGQRSVELPEGVHGLGGDLFVDGALGSRTAALRAPYTDAPGSRGTRYLDAEQIAEHLVDCTRARIQAGFHVIGDAALEEILAGFALARERIEGIAMRRHRLEHLEMAGAEQIAALAELGVVGSVQPLFDRAWGGDSGMYTQRLGADRASAMNPFAALAAAGVILAFGSDSPVTPMRPWEAVRAAVHHRTPGSGISPRAAFAAHTRGGWRAAGVDDGITGTLVPGAPATYAVWEVEELVSAPGDERVQRWSTDPRARVPALPSLAEDSAPPRCLATVLRGATIHS
ncbi:amidohydrolase family protein [Sciscionella marina]|uniref:amidohydrolase n=1 Tax=Sciscionella marina TaxID=508770 RepID=UPI000361E39D